MSHATRVWIAAAAMAVVVVGAFALVGRAGTSRPTPEFIGSARCATCHASQYAAWQSFLAGQPEMKARWEVYLDNALVNPRAGVPEIIDPQWPLARSGEEN